MFRWCNFLVLEKGLQRPERCRIKEVWETDIKKMPKLHENDIAELGLLVKCA